MRRQPISEEVQTTGDNGQLKGLILCHGHIHNTHLPNYLPTNITWTLVDNNELALPDIVASYKTVNGLRTIGLFSWDYVVNHHCPAYGSIERVQQLLRSGRRLLKPTGRLVFPHLLGKLLIFLYEDRYIELGRNQRARRILLQEFHEGRHLDVNELLDELVVSEEYSRYESYSGNYRDNDIDIVFVA
jgi:SAM-dependent methyltransferase